jgi:hypothetical protein
MLEQKTNNSELDEIIIDSSYFLTEEDEQNQDGSEQSNDGQGNEEQNSIEKQKQLLKEFQQFLYDNKDEISNSKPDVKKEIYDISFKLLEAARNGNYEKVERYLEQLKQQLGKCEVSEHQISEYEINDNSTFNNEGEIIDEPIRNVQPTSQSSEIIESLVKRKKKYF